MSEQRTRHGLIHTRDGLTTDASYASFQGLLHARYAGCLVLFGCMVSLLLTIWFPPTVRLGAIGWAVSLPITFSVAVAGVRLATGRRGMLEPRTIVVLGVGAAARFAMLEWLSGAHSPYTQLLMTFLLVAVVLPPRGSLVIVVAGTLAAFSPALYGHIDVPELGTEFGLLGVMVGVISYIGHAELDHQQELVIAQEASATLARHDELTGLLNRRAFDEAMRASVAGADGRRVDDVACLLIGDVDAFKQINDTFGHLEGDAALIRVAEALRETIRPPDTAFRWAGDEFAVILRHTPLEEAEMICARIRSEVANRCTLPDGSAVLMSFGAAPMQADVDDTLRLADRALLSEKARRRPRRASVVA